MKRYTITFKEGFGDVETESVIYRGLNAEHAVERFLDQMDRQGGSEGITILSTVPTHRLA